MPEKLNIERLKREAKRLKGMRNIPHTRALDEVAKTYQYKSWAALMTDQNRLEREEQEQNEDEVPRNADAHLSPYDNPAYVKAIFRP
jgi:hypothetical protein